MADLTYLDKLEAAARAATPGEWNCFSDCVEIEDSVTLVHCMGSRFNEAGQSVDAAFIAAANPDVVLGLIADLRAALQAQQGDCKRLDFIEAHPEKQLRHHKRRWAFVGFTNYEYETFKTAREAIDAALAARGEG